ncbi:CC-NBS-LRR resistance protein, partial [Trifolium pratense]
WLEKVNEVIERANQLHKDPRRANARCSTWRFPNLILRHQLSRKATKIANDVIQVQGKGKFDQVGHLPILDGVASSSTRGDEIYETRESLKDDILKALADLNSCNIGVYGLGGVGKTTLVEEVAQISKQRKLFVGFTIQGGDNFWKSKSSKTKNQDGEKHPSHSGQYMYKV